MNTEHDGFRSFSNDETARINDDSVESNIEPPVFTLNRNFSYMLYILNIFNIICEKYDEHIEEVVEKHTKEIKYTKEKYYDDTCPICMETYEEGDKLTTIIGCKHYFHSNCISSWFDTKLNCPLCRHELK